MAERKSGTNAPETATAPQPPPPTPPREVAPFDVGGGLAAVEDALATVQKTLDKLTASGEAHAAAVAFELARAQYATSIRSSWPGNLASLAGALTKVAEDASLGSALGAGDREALERAIATFKSVRHE